MPDTLNILTRKAPAAKSTWNAETRTLEVKASGFADVKRYGYIERLSNAPGAWDLTRVDSAAGVPFLDSHNSYGLGGKLGQVLSAGVRQDGLFAVVKLGESDAANALVRDLVAGIGCAISIGYSVQKWTLDDSGDVPVRIGTSITLLEVSAVSIAADPTAAVRSIQPQEDRQMSDTPAQREFTAETRATLVQRAGLSGSFLRKHAETPEVEFRAAIMDEMVRRSEASAIFPHVDHSTCDVSSARAMADGLLARALPGHKPSDEGRQYAGLTTVEIARRCLEVGGQRTAGSPADVVQRALHTTSDFPAVLGDALSRSLAASYKPASAALKAVARQTTARDFRDKHSIRLSEGPGLEKVNEAGEFKRGSFEESKESYRLATYGKVFAITRQALVNDDLGAFADLPRQLAQTAGALEAKTLASLVMANPTMSDGKSVFHADHKNLAAAGAALSVAALSAGRLAMRQQVDLSGELISVTPKFLIVGPEIETDAEEVLATIAAAKVDDVNPFSGKLQLVVEPRLSGKAWYLSADPAEIDGLEYCYLEGEEGPQIESQAGFDVDGLQVRCRLDFATAFVEGRSWYRNPGA